MAASAAMAGRAPLGGRYLVSRILVVEAEPDQRFILRKIFERAGHEVVDASHGAEALEHVRGAPPELVVTDMMMPVMDGRELIRRLRADPATARIPIIAVTGNGELADADHQRDHRARPPPGTGRRGVTFLFHNLIQLRYIELNSATGRALNVVKMRSSNHTKDLYQFEIGEQGPEIGGQLEGVTGALGWSALRAANAIR